MNKKRVFFLILILLMIASGFVFHIRFSAYASCRALAMNTKGFSAWKYEATAQEGSQAKVSFSDIYNNPLTCNATRIGPFWFATSYSRYKDMKNKNLLYIFIVALSTFLLSCGLQNQTLRKQIENEEKAWAELGVSSYRIKVIDSSIWYQIELDIIVKNSIIESIESTCGHAPLDYEATNCKNKISRIDANEYTLEGLFKLLQTSEQDFEHNYGNIKEVDWYESLSVSFDEQYHFPIFISFNHPQVADEEYTIKVSDFEILE